MVQKAFSDLIDSFRDRDEKIGTTGPFNAYLGNRAGAIIADMLNRLVNYWTDSGDNGVAYLAEGCGIPLLENPGYRGKGIRLAYPPGVDSRRDVPHVLGLSQEGLIGVAGVTPAEQHQNANLFPKTAQLDLYRVTPTYPTPTYGVSISTGFVYAKSSGRDYWQKGNYDIPTSARPDVGKHRLALLVLDRSTNLPDLVLSAQVTNVATPSANSGAFTIADVLSLSPGVNQDPLAVLYLYGEQDVISEADCLRQYEVRRWMAGSANYYQTIQDSGSDKPQEPKLNLIAGSNITLTIADDSGNNRTNVTIAASGGGGGVSANPSTCEGRLTLSTGVPVTTSDVTAATTIYFAPYKGNQIGTYSGSAWSVNSFTEKSLSLSGYTADTNYDIFIVDSSLALEAVAWTNDTTRATALTLQDGIYVKSGSTTRRYLGTIRITGTTGQCEDSQINRFVWNAYNRVYRTLFQRSASASWSYSSSTWRQANAESAYKLQLIAGLSEDVISVHFGCRVGANNAGVSIGENSTSASAANAIEGINVSIQSAIYAHLVTLPRTGYSYYAPLESSVSNSSCTFWGTNTSEGNNAGIGALWNC